MAIAGINWTKNAAKVGTVGGKIVFGNGMFMLVSESGVYKSLDNGVTWTRLGNTPLTGGFGAGAGAYGNGVFIFASESGSATTLMWKTTDGITWSTVTSASGSVKDIIFANNMFIAIKATNSYATSTDGITWTDRAFPLNVVWTGITYGKGLFVVVADNTTNTKVLTSPDGITWTQRTSPGGTWQKIAYGNGIFVAVRLTATQTVMTSPDAITWTLRTAPTTTSLGIVIFANGHFVLYGGTTMFRSFTGTSFVTVTTVTPAVAFSYGIANDNNFIIMSNVGDIVRSEGQTRLLKNVNPDTPIDLNIFGTFTKSFNVIPTLSYPDTPTDFRFKPDGTKIYVIPYSNGYAIRGIYQYTLTTPWDIQTAVLDGYYITNDQVTSFSFNNDGTYVYLAGARTYHIGAYPLTIPWDLSTAGSQYFAYTSFSTNRVGIDISTDGKEIYSIGTSGNVVEVISLPEANVLTGVTALASENKNIGFVGKLNVLPNGKEIFVANGVKADQFILATANNPSTGVIGGTYTTIAPVSIQFNADYTIAFILSNGIIYEVPMAAAKAFLIKDMINNKIYTIVNSALVELGTGNFTESMFLDNGVSDTLEFNDIIFNQIANNLFSVNEYTATDVTTRSALVTYTPNPHLILPTGDINIGDIVNIDSFNLTANQTGTGVVRIIISIDSGITWKSYQGGSWINVDIGTIANVETNGMTISAFNALSSAQIMALIGTPNKLRFGYYLEINAVTDVVNTDQIAMTVDMNGEWTQATHKTDYHYSYENNTTLKVQLYNNGNFKINY